MKMSENSQFVQIWEALAYGIASIVIVLLVFSHSHNIKKDFSQSQDPVKHNRSYKAVSLFTFLSILSYLLFVLIVLIGRTIGTSIGICQYTAFFSSFFGNFGKCFCYCVFLIRLDTMYGKSNGNNDSSSNYYKRRTLGFYFVLVAIMTVVLLITQIVMYFTELMIVNKNDFYVLDNDNMFPYYCSFNFDGNPFNLIFAMTMGIFLIYDLIINIIFPVLFILPLLKSIKQFKEMFAKNIETDSTNIKKPKKDGKYFEYQAIINESIKHCILVCVLCVSSIISLTTILLSINLWGVDIVINTICLMLMTPYYNSIDENIDCFSYDTLCKLCKICCQCKI